MKKKKFAKIASLALVLTFLVVPAMVSASSHGASSGGFFGGFGGGLVGDCGPAQQGVPVPCGPGFANAPAGQGTITYFILLIINVLLIIIGLLAVLFIIIGGFRYVTAQGNDEQIESAKSTIKNSIIGLVIVILSFVIVRVIANALIFGSAGV